MKERKIIFIEIDDEITTILGKIEKSKVDAIALVFPEKALIFESIINIKLLFEKLKEQKKDVHVVTKDAAGKKLLEKAGFIFYKMPTKKLPKREEGKGNSFVRVQKLKPGNMLLKPIKTNFKKVSLTELIAQEEKKKKTQEPKKKRDVGKELHLESSEFKMWSEKLLSLTIKRRNFILFLIGAIGIFLIIGYVALPSASVKIRPASNIIEKTTNILLVDRERKKNLSGPEKAHAIATFPVETIIEKTEEFPATGEVFTGSNARGKIKIYNERLKPWILVEKTRFQTEDGIIFRTEEKITVPGASYSMVRDENGKLSQEKIPGNMIISIVADEMDAEKKLVGERGNISENAHLFIPALDAASQKIIYGKSVENFTGGVTEAYRILTQADLDTATKKIKEHIETTVQKEFQAAVRQQNIDKSLNLVLFGDKKFVIYKFLELNLPKESVGKPLKSFMVDAKVQVRGVAYDEEEFYRVLENELKSKVHPQKQLVAIDRNSMTYQVVTSDSDPGDLNRIKIAVTIKGIEEFDLNSETEGGRNFMSRIKEGVLGKNADEAKYFIQNMEEVNSVQISVWPFWSSTIPAIDSNISFKIL